MSRPNWPNQVSPKPKYSRWTIVDLAAPDDRRLVDRLEVVLAVVGLEGDVDRLGQVLERGLDADLARIDLQPHVAQAAGPPRRDRPGLPRLRPSPPCSGGSPRAPLHRAERRVRRSSLARIPTMTTPAASARTCWAPEPGWLLSREFRPIIAGRPLTENETVTRPAGPGRMQQPCLLGRCRSRSIS